jgi:hypothetical protein
MFSSTWYSAANRRLVELEHDYTSNTRKSEIVEGKVKVITIGNGKKQADMCRKFVPVNSTFQKIWKNWAKIFTSFEQKGSRIKRVRQPERSDVNEVLLKQFKQTEVTMYQ